MSENDSKHDVLKAMLQKAYDKLATAHKDMEFGFFGDASSRSYYAAFHAISAVLAEKGMTFSSHAMTLGSFNREFVKSGIFPSDTFRKLQRLYEDRQTGDYDFSRNINQETAQIDITDAEWLVNRCLEYLEKTLGQPLLINRQ